MTMVTQEQHGHTAIRSTATSKSCPRNCNLEATRRFSQDPVCVSVLQTDGVLSSEATRVRQQLRRNHILLAVIYGCKIFLP